MNAWVIIELLHHGLKPIFEVTKFLTFFGHCTEINTRHHGYRS